MTINATNGPYELLNVTSAGNIVDFVREVNSLTGDYFMTGMLLAGFVITFMAMKGDASPREALMGSGFITTVISVFFFFLDFISGARLIIIVIIYVVIFSVSQFVRDT